MVKESACNAGDLGSIPGLGRFPGEGNGDPLQYSGLDSKEWDTTEPVSLSLSAQGFPGGPDSKESACKADLDSLPGSGRSSEEENGYTL